MLAGCGATAPKKPDGPPPPQNLVGSTDQLQLVTELSLNLSREYGAGNLMVVLGVEGTLVAESDDVCLLTENVGGEPMQEDTAFQVQRISDAGIPVVLISLRDNDCEQQTRSQLSAIGVSAAEKTLYTAGSPKGPALHDMIQSSGAGYPTLIIMADNLQSNLSSVMREFSELGTKVHSWRYTR